MEGLKLKTPTSHNTTERTQRKRKIGMKLAVRKSELITLPELRICSALAQ